MFIHIFDEVFAEVIRTFPTTYETDMQEIFNRPRYGIFQKIIPKIIEEYNYPQVQYFCGLIDSEAIGLNLPENIIINFKVSVIDALQSNSRFIDFFMYLYQTDKNDAVKFIRYIFAKVYEEYLKAEEALEDVQNCEHYVWDNDKLAELVQILADVPVSAFTARPDVFALLQGIVARAIAN